VKHYDSWLAEAVEIENNADRNFKDLEEMLGNAKALIGNNRECKAADSAAKSSSSQLGRRGN